MPSKSLVRACILCLLPLLLTLHALGIGEKDEDDAPAASGLPGAQRASSTTKADRLSLPASCITATPSSPAASTIL